MRLPAPTLPRRRAVPTITATPWPEATVEIARAALTARRGGRVVPPVCLMVGLVEREAPERLPMRADAPFAGVAVQAPLPR